MIICLEAVFLIEVIPIKVGVISDTHIPGRSKQIPEAVKTGLQGVDLIIHCGDIVAGYVLDELREIAPVEAVYGNMDFGDLKQQLPKTQVVKVGNFNVGVVHGDGRCKTIDNAFNAFPFMDLDCIVFGHSHIPIITEREGILMLNPGSPTDKRMKEQFSFGLLHAGEELKAEIVFFSSKE